MAWALWQAVRAAAQDHRVAGLQAQGGGVGADVGAAFVDHADHADRGGDALDAQAVRAGPVGQGAVQRVRQRGDFFQAASHGLDAGLGQGQAVDERGGAFVGGDIGLVGGQDIPHAVAQRVRHRRQRAITRRRAAARQCVPGRPGRRGGCLQVFNRFHLANVQKKQSGFQCPFPRLR